MFPKLFVPGSKWRDPRPNLKVGDLCLLLSKKGSTNDTTYKYCIITRLNPSDDGLVRSVWVKYYITSLKMKEVLVDIRRLVILPTT